ncbi:MAG TPA: hypothetical protein VFZ65_13550, partial [Planctomycetota bacterium]|nr:hypothetical protein [Planctomycetota bacterium]
FAEQAVQASSHGAPLPSCVPPPLPAIEPPPLPERAPPPVPRSRPARPRRRGVVAVLLLLLVGGMTLAMFGTAYAARAQRSRARAYDASVTAQRAAAGVRRSAPTGLAAKVEQFVGGVQKSMRSVSSRKQQPKLHDLDASLLAAAPDCFACGSMVEGLARSPTFSPGHAQKLERLGLPAFLAGVSLLQGLDYEQAESCRRAANVQQYLSYVTAVDGLSLPANDGEPSRTDTYRFLVVADAWRRFAEQFTTCEADFTRLLAAKGKLAAGVDR